MARDYSSRRNNPPDKNGKRKASKRPTPAARPVRQKKTAPPKKKKAATAKRPRNGSGAGRAPTVRSGAPGCVWLLCGVCLGIAGLSIYYIASRPSGHGPQSVSINLPNGAPANSDDSGDAGNSKPAATSASTEHKTEKKPEPRFSFYKMLPNYQVEVPAGQRAPAPVTDNAAPHEAEPAANTPAPADAAANDGARGDGGKPASAAPDSGSGYVIQAGAFSTEGDADRRKAQLALLGVSAEIVDIKTSSGKTVYRVQSDVFNSSNKAQSMAERLHAHGIETMVRQAR